MYNKSRRLNDKEFKRFMKSNRILILRILLGCLILLNMALIFWFSNENAQQSSETSGRVAQSIAEITVPDFEQKPAQEQQAIVNRIQLPVRKLAHMTEFASLGGLIFLLLLTWRGKLPLRYGLSLLLTALYAVSDEFHQKFSSGRAPQFTDVLIDLAGALLSCSIILLVWLVTHRSHSKKKMITTHYQIPCAKLSRPVRISVVADLHGNPHDRLLEALRAEAPDVILIPGDLTDYEDLISERPACLGFLRACASLAPTFYSIGNHETGCYRGGKLFSKPRQRPIPAAFADRVAATGARLLRNEAVPCGELTICGLDSGLDGKTNLPDPSALASFAALPGVRVLLCHHPEYYVPYISKTDIDLTVCGHAHGGQWRFFGRGVFAPDQGLFPKYTSGLLDGGRCVISRGLGNHTHVPRINNPRELVIIEFGS